MATKIQQIALTATTIQEVVHRLNSSLQLAHHWWATLGQADRQRVWDGRHSYLAGDSVEKAWPKLACPSSAYAEGCSPHRVRVMRASRCGVGQRT